MKTISGILGVSSFLFLLATLGAATFPDELPNCNWMVLLGGAAVCAVLSVVTFRRSKKSNE